MSTMPKQSSELDFFDSLVSDLQTIENIEKEAEDKRKRKTLDREDVDTSSHELILTILLNMSNKIQKWMSAENQKIEMKELIKKELKRKIYVD